MGAGERRVKLNNINKWAYWRQHDIGEGAILLLSAELAIAV